MFWFLTFLGHLFCDSSHLFYNSHTLSNSKIDFLFFRHVLGNVLNTLNVCYVESSAQACYLKSNVINVLSQLRQRLHYMSVSIVISFISMTCSEFYIGVSSYALKSAPMSYLYLFFPRPPS